MKGGIVKVSYSIVMVIPRLKRLWSFQVFSVCNSLPKKTWKFYVFLSEISLLKILGSFYIPHLNLPWFSVPEKCSFFLLTKPLDVIVTPFIEEFSKSIIPPQDHKNKKSCDKTLNIFLKQSVSEYFLSRKNYSQRTGYVLTLGQQVSPLVERLQEFTLE